jgi:hypothetical protein
LRDISRLFFVQLLFRLIIKLLILAFWLSVFLPKLVRAANDIYWFRRHLLSDRMCDSSHLIDTTNGIAEVTVKYSWESASGLSFLKLAV